MQHRGTSLIEGVPIRSLFKIKDSFYLLVASFIGAALQNHEIPTAAMRSITLYNIAYSAYVRIRLEFAENGRELCENARKQVMALHL
ncbi:MAG: hypothetical protein JWM11_5518 [Planctomycetaceae bacterium]|nr:hypothetical protein [Planctomycetaceae bacterium]